MSFPSMQFKTLSVLVSLLLAGALSTAPAMASYTEGAVSNGGSLKGSVKLSGSGANANIKVTKDQAACGDSVSNDTLVVGKGNTLANVIVEIQGISKGKKWDLPAKFTYDQKKCAFAPHVMIIRPKAEVEVKNSDSVKHNVHTISKGVFNVNKTVAPGKSLKVKKNKIKKSGTVKVVCDLHSWMGGWWIVAENPYIAMTDASGNFEIKDIPPGKYKVRLWQEKLGEQIQEVEIKGGAAATLNASMAAK
ncbi:MAG: carboxypeptidase regulatory-like domain-containing protein [Deltaproteobacteria bacterium]|nr:carboxypeptidase regulatory-like domain-containing protein [Deltaproteobacteria bacterium]